ncbi:hypothetical protein EON77_08105, partial [bacterium]
MRCSAIGSPTPARKPGASPPSKWEPPLTELRWAALFAAAALSCTSAASLAAAPTTPFTADDLVRVERISDPQVSPDGRWVVYTQRSTDLDANRGRTDLWLAGVDEGSAPARRLTSHTANDSSPRWATDGRSVLFLSDRSGTSQVWRLPLDGGEPAQVTDYPLDVGTFKPSPDGRLLVLSLEVFPDCADLACTRKRLDEKPSGTGKRF